MFTPIGLQVSKASVSCALEKKKNINNFFRNSSRKKITRIHSFKRKLYRSGTSIFLLIFHVLLEFIRRNPIHSYLKKLYLSYLRFIKYSSSQLKAPQVFFLSCQNYILKPNVWCLFSEISRFKVKILSISII